MAFIAEKCKFNGVSCETYDLVLARGGGNGDDNAEFASGPEISESYVSRMYRPYFYGVSRPNKLSFQMTLVLNNCRLDAGSYLTRSQIESIAKWLTSPNTYSWLEIFQSGMYNYNDTTPTAPIYRYRCMITGLELLFINEQPYGVTATVTCDSPYAYASGISSIPFLLLVIPGVGPASDTKTIVNEGTIESGVFPVFTITQEGQAVALSSMSIKNNTTNEELTISTIPATAAEVTVDCGKKIIKASDGSNLYQYSNFVFPHLARGNNSITISYDTLNDSDTATVVVNVTGDVPVDIGA